MSKPKKSKSRPQPRYPRPFLRSQNHQWYVQIKGKQILLGPDREEAFTKYHRIMTGKINRKTTNYSVTTVFTAYLEHLQNRVRNGEVADSTFDHARHYLTAFMELYPRLNINSVETSHVANFLKSLTTLGPHTKFLPLSVVKTALRWAFEQNLLTSIPAIYVKTLPPGVRDYCVPYKDWDRILELAASPRDKLGAFRDYVEVALLTGARPWELYRAEAHNYNPEAHWLYYPAQEAKGKKIARIVYLPHKAVAIIEKLCKRYPEGRLFRNSWGRPWRIQALRARFAQAFHKEFPRLTPYITRHSFSGHRVVYGQDFVTIAHLLGHTSTKQLMQRYGHLDKAIQRFSLECEDPADRNSGRADTPPNPATGSVSSPDLPRFDSEATPHPDKADKSAESRNQVA